MSNEDDGNDSIQEPLQVTDIELRAIENTGLLLLEISCPPLQGEAQISRYVLRPHVASKCLEQLRLYLRRR